MKVLFKKTTIYTLLLSAAVFLLFWGLTKTFYQQDEWHGMGDFLVKGPSAIAISSGSVIEIVLGRGRLASNALVYFFFTNFPFDVFWLSFFMIAIHAINTLVLYFLLLKLTRKHLPSFVGSLFFAVNSVSAGALTWPASATATLPSGLFIILSLFCFFQFLKETSVKWSFAAFVCLYISLYFKESAMPFFFFIPFASLIFKKYSLRKFILSFWFFFLFCAIAVGTRLLTFQAIQSSQDLFVTGATKYPIHTVATRAVLYPLTSFSLLYIPSKPFMEFAKHITWFYYPFFDPALYDLVAQTAVMDIVSLSLTLIILFTTVLLFHKSSKVSQKKVLFFVVFILFSFLPYIIIGKSYAYLESRYYYIAVFGAGVLISLFLARLSQISKKIFALVLVFLLFVCFIHAREINFYIEKQIALAKERRYILESITQQVKLNASKSVFYITSDKSFYIANNPLPMQQGIGYTLLVWLAKQNKLPNQLLPLVENYFLWEMDKEGYSQIGKYGFGYFWEESKVRELILEKKIKEEDVVALYYKSHDKMLTNITSSLKWLK